MKKYLIETYGFSVEKAAKIEKEYNLLILRTKSSQTIDDFVKVFLNLPQLKYKKINLFGERQSKGTFDDFFNPDKYETFQQAYSANDYVECDFVKDEQGVLYIEARNVKNPDIRKYHKLNYQSPILGLDASDEKAGCELAVSLF